MPVWRGLAETIVRAISGGLVFCRFGTGVAGLAGCVWDSSERALLFSSFVALGSDQVSCLAVHVAPICSDQVLSRLLCLWRIEPNGCGLHVIRVAREW